MNNRRLGDSEYLHTENTDLSLLTTQCVPRFAWEIERPQVDWAGVPLLRSCLSWLLPGVDLALPSLIRCHLRRISRDCSRFVCPASHPYALITRVISVFQQENKKNRSSQEGKSTRHYHGMGASDGENQRGPCWAGKPRALAGPFRFGTKESVEVLMIFGPGLGP
jgi:hypothetical protein